MPMGDFMCSDLLGEGEIKEVECFIDCNSQIYNRMCHWSDWSEWNCDYKCSNNIASAVSNR
jgi:hypothetical protein